MEDYIDLRDQVEALIQPGRLRHFIAGHPQTPLDKTEKPPNRKVGGPEPLPEIKVIAGGSVGGGE